MDRRPSTTFSDISANVGSVQQQNVFDDDEKMVNNNNCATRFEVSCFYFFFKIFLSLSFPIFLGLGFKS